MIGAVLSISVGAQDRDTIPLATPDKSSVKELKSTQGPLNPAVDADAPRNLKVYLAGVETYGSKRINEQILRQFLGKDLEEWLRKGLEFDPTTLQTEALLAERVRAHFNFQSARWSIFQYEEEDGMAVHLTLDVVEKQDVAKRENFLPEPTQEFTDPDNLIKSMREYVDTALDLIDAGEIDADAEDCAAFSCPYGHKHLKLKKYESLFVQGVKKNASQLENIFNFDKRPEYRSAAAFILPYLKDGKKVVNLMVSRIKDPDVTVRNNVLRVLSEIAELHQSLVIPYKPVLEAMSFARVSDRSRAVYIAYLMSMNSQAVRETLLKNYIPTLIEIMSSNQPDHRDLAHLVLQKISGRRFAASDVNAWSKWYARLPAQSGSKK